MTDLSQQTEQLLKAATALQATLNMIHYDLMAIAVMVLAFGLIIAFKRRRD
jgi:hypothetical protein